MELQSDSEKLKFLFWMNNNILLINYIFELNIALFFALKIFYIQFYTT